MAIERTVQTISVGTSIEEITKEEVEFLENLIGSAPYEGNAKIKVRDSRYPHPQANYGVDIEFNSGDLLDQLLAAFDSKFHLRGR